MGNSLKRDRILPNFVCYFLLNISLIDLIDNETEKYICPLMEDLWWIGNDEKNGLQGD